MPELPKGLAVWTDDPSDQESVKLASRLGVPFSCGEEPPACEWLFFYEEGALFLHCALFEDFKPIYVDYLSGEFLKRWRSASRNDILAKAVGLKKGTRSVCDATCGLGYDAFFLASFDGIEVTACERNVVAAELVLDALLRVKETGMMENFPMLFRLGDGREFLREMGPASFDCVYLDPMYPRGADKSAKQKKEMQLFRELVGDDTDADSLFAAAWAAARGRVVVKRPDDAPALDVGRAPDIVFDGKTVRYDVYLKEGK